MSPHPAESAAPPVRFSLRRLVHRRLRFVAVVMPLACALLLIPFSDWIFELLRQFRLWNAVIGVGTALLLALLRDWKFAAVALLAGLWQGWPVWSYSRPLVQEAVPAAPGKSFTLMTCNLLFECREPERMIASIREANPDVMLLLEFTPEWQKKFADGLWKDYPHRVEEPEEVYAGICLASKLPLEGAKPMLAAYSPVIRAVVTVAGERITLLGVHPAPPIWPEQYTYWRDAFLEWPKLLSQTGTRHRILLGDLNCTPFARTFDMLCETAGLRDSARGFSLTNTWHIKSTFLGLPLDHILITPEVLVAERALGPATGSDHRWVMTRLVPVP